MVILFDTYFLKLFFYNSVTLHNYQDKKKRSFSFVWHQNQCLYFMKPILWSLLFDAYLYAYDTQLNI